MIPDELHIFPKVWLVIVPMDRSTLDLSETVLKDGISINGKFTEGVINGAGIVESTCYTRDRIGQMRCSVEST